MFRHLLLLSSVSILAVAPATFDQDDPVGDRAQDGGTSEVPKVEQGVVAELRPGELPQGANPVAVAAWRAMLASAGVTGARDPITSFDVQLSLLTRSGRRGLEQVPETHDFFTRVLYLAPMYVRYRLSEQVETGYGPDGFWVRDGAEVRSLDGREFKTDREQVAEVVTLCINFLSVADLGQLRMSTLDALASCPLQGLPRRPGFDYRRMTWMRIATPDFKLVEAIQPRIEGATGAKSGANYQVFFGLDPESKLPRCLHVSRIGARPEEMFFEQLILVDDWKSAGAEGETRVTLPHRLYIYERLPEHPLFATFLEEPDREVYVRDGCSLYPKLQLTDFEP